MSAENILIFLGALIVVAKVYRAVGRIIGHGEMREAHDRYIEAAREGKVHRRIEMINAGNVVAFPNKPFTKAFRVASTKEQTTA